MPLNHLWRLLPLRRADSYSRPEIPLTPLTRITVHVYSIRQCCAPKRPSSGRGTRFLPSVIGQKPPSIWVRHGRGISPGCVHQSAVGSVSIRVEVSPAAVPCADRRRTRPGPGHYPGRVGQADRRTHGKRRSRASCLPRAGGRAAELPSPRIRGV